MQRPVAKALRRMVDLYFKKRIARSAAAFAFFFTLSLFPMLIILSVMLGSLNLDARQLAQPLQALLPWDTLETILDYLHAVSQNGGTALFAAGLASMVLMSASAFRTVQTAMADIFGTARFRGLFGTLFSFVFAVLFLGVMYLSLLILATSGWFIRWLSGLLGISRLGLFWNWFRFLLLFLLLVAVLYGVYRITAPAVKPRRQRIIGAASAAAALVLCSIVFSWFIGFSTNYSLVYGSLASMVVLMLWLYLCGNVLILGNVLNLVINDLRAERKAGKGSKQ